MHYRSCLALSLLIVAHPAPGAEVSVVRTNSVDHWITNQIEVQVPVNHFFNQFRTNWSERYITNTVEVTATAWRSVTQTNTTIVEALRTNFVQAFATNWTALTRTNTTMVEALRTNFVRTFATNWATLTRTNQTTIEKVLTNTVTLYRTNSRALTLTNWETAVVIRTNWVVQPVTNVAVIDMPAPRPVAPPAATTVVSVPQKSDDAFSWTATPAMLTDALVIEVLPTPPPSPSGQTITQLRVKWLKDESSALLCRWRVEREDGAILCFGQEREFKRTLPPGKYNVEIRAQRDSAGPVMAGQGVLSIDPSGVHLQQRLVSKS